MRRSAFACLFGLISVAGAVLGDDLGYVRLENRAQAITAQAILDHGLIRFDNRYLVSASTAQQRKLAEGGVAFEMFRAETDPNNWQVVYPAKEDQGLPRDIPMAAAVPLEDGLNLVEASSGEASSWRRNEGVKVRGLGDLKVPFEYTAVSVPLVPFEAAAPSDSVANRVRQDSVYAISARLQAFYTRYSYSDSVNRARDWLAQKFQAYGYSVSTPQFSLSGYPSYNVKAIKLGTAEPDKVIVVGAHYDATSGNPYVLAPGADDNGSGTTMVLELARILKDIPLRKTVIFMPFSGEEQGLWGAEDAAADFKADGTKLEVMFNCDMIGYCIDATWNTNIQCGQNTAYRDLVTATAGRVSSLVMVNASLAANSDHYPFYQQGFPIAYAHEGDFNTPNYHTTHDSTTKLNFPYMTDVIKTFAASVAYVADAGSPVGIDSIVDQGDGSGLSVFFSNCRSDVQYVVYRGIASGAYTDSAVIGPGVCSHLFTGLTEGRTYYFAVKGTPTNGNPPVYLIEDSEMPLLNPRTPSGVVAEPAIGSIALSWNSNHEADLDHYNLYRKADYEGDFALLAGNLTGLSYTDNSVMHWVTYTYKLKAVDQTGFESPFSNEVIGTPATFDKGILIVDEMTRDYDFMPTQEAEEAWLDTVLSATPHGVFTVDAYQDALRRSTAGQYSSIWWLDDDIVNKLVRYSQDSLRWFAGFNNDLLIAGYQTIPLFIPAPSPGHLLYDEFMVQAYTLNNAKDFAGAKGEGGWPAITLAPTRGINRMGDIPSLTMRSGGTIIYRYDSNTDDPTRENTIVGIAYSGAHGKRIVLSFPLYYMTPSSVQAFMSAAKSYFGENGQAPAGGDVDGSGFVDVSDLSMMIDFFFFGLPIPLGSELADMDGSCSVDIGDLQWMIDYLFFSGPAPLPSCAK